MLHKIRIFNDFILRLGWHLLLNLGYINYNYETQNILNQTKANALNDLEGDVPKTLITLDCDHQKCTSRAGDNAIRTLKN